MWFILILAHHIKGDETQKTTTTETRKGQCMFLFSPHS